MAGEFPVSDRSDPTPVCSLAQGCCAERKRRPAARLYDDPEESFALQLALRDELGFASAPFYFYATYGTWEWSANPPQPCSELCSEPTAPFYPVACEADLVGLALPPVARAGMLPVALRFSDLQAERGLPVSVVIGGVFTIAANLCGLDRLLMWLIEKPRLVTALMERAAAHLFEVVEFWVERFGAERVTPIVFEAMPTIISPRQLARFVLPHQERLQREILQRGVPRLALHACGARGAALELWARLPLGEGGLWGVGAEVTLREASRLRPEVVLVGNVAPKLLVEGTPEAVRDEARRCLAVGRAHPGGFLLAPGCVLERGVPEENLRALIAAAREA